MNCSQLALCAFHVEFNPMLSKISIRSAESGVPFPLYWFHSHRLSKKVNVLGKLRGSVCPEVSFEAHRRTARTWCRVFDVQSPNSQDLDAFGGKLASLSRTHVSRTDVRLDDLRGSCDPLT